MCANQTPIKLGLPEVPIPIPMQSPSQLRAIAVASGRIQDTRWQCRVRLRI